MVDNLLPICLSADEGMTKASILTLMNSKPNLVVSLVVQYQGILPLEFTALLFNPHRVFPPIIFVQQCNGTLLRSDLVPENNVLADRRFDVLFHVVWSVSWLNIRQVSHFFDRRRSTSQNHFHPQNVSITDTTLLGPCLFVCQQDQHPRRMVWCDSSNELSVWRAGRRVVWWQKIRQKVRWLVIAGDCSCCSC